MREKLFTILKNKIVEKNSSINVDEISFMLCGFLSRHSSYVAIKLLDDSEHLVFIETSVSDLTGIKDIIAFSITASSLEICCDISIN